MFALCSQHGLHRLYHRGHDRRRLDALKSLLETMGLRTMSSNKAARMTGPIVIVAVVIGVFAATAGLAQAETRKEFCNRWHSVCSRCSGLGATVPREKCL